MNLSDVSDVRFGGVSARFTRDSATQITAFIPENAVSDEITVTTAGGKSATSSTPFVAQPKITSFTTPNGNAPNASVIIKGINLDTVTEVRFGTAVGTINAKTPDQLTVGIPPGALTGKLVVKSPNGDVPSPTDFIARPVINTITERAGAGGTVEINGLNLSEPIDVKFGNVSAEIVGKEPTKITLKVPANAITEKLIVRTNGGEVTSTQTFTFIPPPTITGVAVNNSAVAAAGSGPVGASVVIHGTNLGDTVEVKFGDVVASIGNKTATTITVTVPAGATTGPIKVKTLGGEATSGTFTITQ